MDLLKEQHMFMSNFDLKYKQIESVTVNYGWSLKRQTIRNHLLLNRKNIFI